MRLIWDFLLLRFYTSGFMSTGSNYFDILTHAEAWVFEEGSVEVCYDKLLDFTR